MGRRPTLNCGNGCSDGNRRTRDAFTPISWKVDPEAAVKIHPNDLRRTVRALEVFHLRERKLSDFHREHGFRTRLTNFSLFFLVRSRAELYPRIEERVDQMIAEGLEAEVKSLMDRGMPSGSAVDAGPRVSAFLNFFKGHCFPRRNNQHC